MVAVGNIGIEILVRVGNGEPVSVGTATVPWKMAMIGHTLVIDEPETAKALRSALKSALRATKPKRFRRSK